MTPAPQEHTLAERELPGAEHINEGLKGDAIVISGMSGMYPQSSSVKELSDILYNKVNPVTSEGLRWKYKHPEAASYAGMAPAVDRFDAQFFTIFYRLGNYLDPMARKLLEHTYQAIYDAGLCPADLNGKKVAVFIGSSFSDMESSAMMYDRSEIGLGIIGTNKAMFANRISYWLNVKGPSLGIDEIDCSSFVALEQAISAINRGDCEAAIVGGACLNLNPHASIYHKRLSCQPADGKTKSFAANADGYSLADAVGVLLLQKKKHALRVYAEVTHVKNEFICATYDGAEPKFGFNRNFQDTANFIKQFYKEARVPPQAVEYVEAYGTGVPDADKSELDAIAEVYCKEKTEPLLIGSVASNIGVTEAASGITGIVKVLLSFSNGEIPANLHYDHPRQDVDAVRSGRLRVVSEHQRFGRTYAAVNGMSVSGVNSHVLLHGQYKPKDLSRYKSAIPHLVTISGRQETAVQRVIDNLKSKSIDAEELALLHNIHYRNTSGHLGRGYVILDSDENNNTVCLGEKAEFFDDARRPLWFVYSGMGSQWATMGAQLMRIPVFAAAIQRCHQALAPKGLDIVEIITSPDRKIFDNILHSFVGIAAVQIGLTDILHELGLVPDGIIGHSVGELGCAYADGCLTADEMILSAYSRGLASIETPLIRGSMAAVGLGYDEVSKMCPAGIDVACRNSADSSTISGPADIMREFVAQLTAAGVFAKEVPCSNIAYHSRYITDAGPNLLAYLKQVIKHPKRRSERWLSTSVPQDKWTDEEAQHCSAEYHTNNLLSPVLFEETARLIPSNAVLVEVAPHGLLQAILKRSMPADCQNVPLTKRGHPDNALYLLHAIGGLYMKGYLPKLQALYPKVEFPVSTGTPMLSHLIEWVHIEQWVLPTRTNDEKRMAAATQLIISVHDEDQTYLRGNVVRGKMCYPYASTLVAVWDTLAMSLEVAKRQLSVQFSDIQLYSQPLLHDQRVLQLDVRIHKGTGRFEVMQKRSRVMSGYISKLNDKLTTKTDTCDINNMKLSTQDVYHLLQERDYLYGGEFRSIERCSACFCEAQLVWRDNWAALIDGMLQLNVLRQAHGGVCLPTHIRRLYIDVQEHANKHAILTDNKRVMNANLNSILHYTKCGGVTIQNVVFKNLPLMEHDPANIKMVIPLGLGEGDINTKLKKTPQKRKAVSLQSSEVGKLDSLHWVEVPELDSSGITVNVHYAGINMLDVKRATGSIPSESSTYGMDYSGITSSGVRVMGIVHSGAASSQVRAQPEFLWPVPAHWTLEDAATVPLAYALAFYCLKIKGHLRPGMNVLVHGGAGATGQAAISVLLAHNCRVFTTVSDVRKKQFLKKLFPKLKDEDIGYSRDRHFVDYIKSSKQGRCEIVVSCLKGHHKDISLGCLSIEGRYIDIVQDLDGEPYVFGMQSLARESHYIRADMTSLFTHNRYQDMKIISTMLSDGIATGVVRPLSRMTFAPAHAVRACRLLVASRHRGRVLLDMRLSPTTVRPRLACEPDMCQVLFCFNDVLGFQLVHRLISRGASKIYIHVPCRTMYHQYRIESWRKLGIDVTLSTNDLMESKDVAAVISDATRVGLVEGIYITADNNGGTTKAEHLTCILNNIDLMSRSLCPQLRHFAVVSTDGKLAQNMAASRAASGYVVKNLDLSPLTEGQTSEMRLHNCLAMAAIEEALCSPYNVLQAEKQIKQPATLVQQIAALADIKVAGNTNADLTLRELGMAEEKVPSIGTYLNLTYNISLIEEEISLLTLNKINELEDSLIEIVHPSTRGVATFFTKGSADDLRDTIDVLVMPTLFKDPTLTPDEFDVARRYLCIVPGMEGHHGRFHLLCDRLKLPAIVLQTGIDHPHETVPQMGQRCADTIMNKNLTQQNFYLLGYESGAMVALEMAAILENNGYTGTIFLVGYDPEEFQIELEEQLSHLTSDEQLEDSLVRHIFKIMAGEYISELDHALEAADSWSQKVDVCVKYLRGRTTHSAQYSRHTLRAALARLRRVRRHRATPRALRSRLVLLRAASPRPAPDFTRTLQPHSARPVAVHQLHAPLAHATRDIQSSAIVNKYLDAETQQAFESRSQCESYTVNQGMAFSGH